MTHEHALVAAEAAHCAAEQGKYWELRARLFANQDKLESSDLSLHAEAAGLDLRRFRECMESHKHVSVIGNQKAEGIKAGVKITPTFFLGLTEPNQAKVKVLKTISGAQPYAAFEEAITSLLSFEK